MRNTVQRLFVLMVFVHAQFRHQLVHWRRYAARWAKVAVAATCFSVVGLTSYLFDRLPDGWLDIVLRNLDQPQGVLVAVMLSLIGALGFAYYAVMHVVLHALADQSTSAT